MTFLFAVAEPALTCLSPFVPRRSMLEYDSENLNSEEIYSSLRGVTEAIQNFSFRSQEDLMEPLRRDGKRDGMVRRSSIPKTKPAPSYISSSLNIFKLITHTVMMMMMMF